MKKLGALLTGMIAGFGLAVLAGFVQADRIYISGHLVPYGMVLAVSMVILSALWLARAFQTRLAAVGLVSVWVVFTFYFAMAKPDSDQIIFKTWYSTTYLFATAILGGMVCSLPPLSQTKVPMYTRQDIQIENQESTFND